MKTLAATTGVAAGVWLVLYKVPAPKPPETAWYDKSLLYIIAIVFTTAAIVMLISRRIWTFRAIGLFFSALALGVIGWNAVYVRQVGYTVRNDRVVPDTNPGVQEGIGDLWRALLIIGGPLLLLGLIDWLYGRFGPAHHDDLLPPADRRHDIRREEDRIMRDRLAELEGGGK